jgi:hypothetical protein
MRIYPWFFTYHRVPYQKGRSPKCRISGMAEITLPASKPPFHAMSEVRLTILVSSKAK